MPIKIISPSKEYSTEIYLNLCRVSDGVGDGLTVFEADKPSD
ncbi:MAG: hypothetical protein N2645_10800 [Clostridia bacterium]|nr:hypothetical protein [Clostridia bacterium]